MDQDAPNDLTKRDRHDSHHDTSDTSNRYKFKSNIQKRFSSQYDHHHHQHQQQQQQAPPSCSNTGALLPDWQHATTNQTTSSSSLPHGGGGNRYDIDIATPLADNSTRSQVVGSNEAPLQYDTR